VATGDVLSVLVRLGILLLPCPYQTSRTPLSLLVGLPSLLGLGSFT